MNKIKFSCCNKTDQQGSSVNVFICHKQFSKRLELLRSYKKIIIEQFIDGREIQAAIINNKKLGALS